MTRQFGAVVGRSGVSFTLWAPLQKAVALVLDDGADRPMQRDADGVFTIDAADAAPGMRYWYRIAQGLRPDPASRYQPEGPLGPSEVVDTAAFAWTDAEWTGAPPRHRHVLYEMHLGTFTEEGTWRSAAAKLPCLADLGITTIEVMPIAEFPGAFGWGYDGVNLFAPTRLYGTPQDAQHFVNEAHRLGLAVILDVVYNHFGPVGNFQKELSATMHGAPGEWGDSINYDGEGSSLVREFMIQNAAYWIREFHFDGLRLDATQAIQDRSSEHIISEICRAARRAAQGRRVYLVGESEPQDTGLLKGSGLYADGLDAIWNEDWHHAAFVALTGHRQAYFADYRGTAREFASMARHNLLYQGQWYSWQQKGRGGQALGLEPACFVCFLENHDQVANSGVGARLYQQVNQARWRAATALLLLGPGTPLLFQGQEYGAPQPFAYFANLTGELGAAVEKGRLEFMAQFPSLAGDEMRAAIPRPTDPATFARCKLSDHDRTENHWSALHRDLLRLRRTDAVMSRVGTSDVHVESSAPADDVVLIRYLCAEGDRLLVVNLGRDHHSPMDDPLLAPPPSKRWTQLWSSERPQYGGLGDASAMGEGRWIIAGDSATLLTATRA